MDVTDKDISILIGADLPCLHICYDVISGNQYEPIAILTERVGPIRKKQQN